MPARMTLKELELFLDGKEPEVALQFLLSVRSQYGSSLDRLINKYEKLREKELLEIERYRNMCRYEAEARQQGFRTVAGVDEAGRGPLAGPVVAAAVILPEDEIIPGINDSKQLTSNMRSRLYDIIVEKAVAWSIGISDEKCIDEINILEATKKAMKEAIEKLKPKPDIVLLDAVKLDGIPMKQVNIVKGDTVSVSIAAASIVAKVTRDRMIEEMDEKYPQYGFSKHKGYATKEHIEAIKKYGLCPIHRMSFTRNFTG